MSADVIKLSKIFYKTPGTKASCFWYGVFFSAILFVNRRHFINRATAIASVRV